MFTVLKTRLMQKHRTMSYPAGAPPELPDKFPGRPVIKEDACPEGCRACAEVCPVAAVDLDEGGIKGLDTGLCIFCRACEAVCPSRAISFQGDHRLARANREELIVRQGPAPVDRRDGIEAGRPFRRSLKLRQVSAGGCGACEADSNVLCTPAWDMGRFGIQFTASPRHADGILVTGPVTKNMHSALLDTWVAVPAPKVLIAVGACAISGGLFPGHREQSGGVASMLPVDLFVPGCPPHPLTILDGLLLLQGRI